MLVLLAYQGFKIGEVKIDHAPRLYGVSKFGRRRLYEGFMDFMTIFFLTRYLQSPLYFFGYYAIISIILSFIISALYLPLHFISLYNHNPLGTLDKHPLWLLSPILFIISLIFIFFGLLGELIIHLNSTQREIFPINHIAGFGTKEFNQNPGQPTDQSRINE
jgi:hypothetical protein